jgi:hypothetical protein
MTFRARHQVEVLLDDLNILRLEETERDGHAFSGPKALAHLRHPRPQANQQHPSAQAPR